MKTVSLRTGEEIGIVENRKPLARIVPPAAAEADWSETFVKLEKIWGKKTLPGKSASRIVIDTRR